METSSGTENYAQWVRRAVASKSSGKKIVTFFDSSVPEPLPLLREVVAGAFAPSVTSRYASAFNGGNPYVLDLLADRYGVDRSCVLGTTGATGALSLLYRSLLAPGDHVLVERPGFDLFEELGRSRGLDMSWFPRSGEQFAIDFEDLARNLRPDTKMVIVSNLHNPSGMALSAESLHRLARLAEAREFLVVVDEVYGEYAPADARGRPASALSPNFISISSLTKIYGLSTLRCGWIVGAPDVMAPVRRVSDRQEISISNLAHAVAALIMENPKAFDRFTHDTVGAARPVMEARFEAWKREGLVEGALPPFGCICFPRLAGIDDTEAFADWLADRSGVIVAPGEFFGAPGHVRIGFARALDELQSGLDAITDGLRAYRADAPARLSKAV